jgi:Metallopeptidase family M24
MPSRRVGTRSLRRCPKTFPNPLGLMSSVHRRVAACIPSWHNSSKRKIRRQFASVAANPSADKSPWLSDPTYYRVNPPVQVRPWSMPAIPVHIPRPPYAPTGKKSPWKDIIPMAYPIGPHHWWDQHLEDGMRNAGRLSAQCLQYAVSLVKPGVSTAEIDDKVRGWAFAHRCYPSSLNYGKFPGSLCTSVNNVLAHGVPNEYNQPVSFELSLVNRSWRGAQSTWI